MTDINLTVPVQRRSNLYIPRRDLALAASDSISLLATLVESDNPDAPPAVLPGANVTMTVWADPWPRCSGRWDYGCGIVGGILWSGLTYLREPVGTAEFFMPAGTMAGWPLRTLWGIGVGFGDTSQVISRGRLHITPLIPAVIAGSPLILDVDPDGHMDEIYWVA
jgi:hypothetical protein